MDHQSDHGGGHPWRGYPPAVEGLLRPRLRHALDGLLTTRLGLLVAGRGTGKTTVLAQWAAVTSATVVWVRADSTAPAGLVRDIGRAAHAVTGCAPAQRVEHLASELESSSGRLVLVVDDLCPDPDGHTERELESLLLATPPNIHLLVASPTPLSFNLARSELPAALTLGADALRFRASEARALFRKSFRRNISPAEATMLNDAVDGWAAALRLFHLATSGRSQAEFSAAIRRLTKNAHFAADYLERQILDGVPEQLAGLLRRAAQLDILSSERCNALLGLPDSMLFDLEGLGLLRSQDDASTFTMEPVLRIHLLHGPMPAQAAAQLAADRAALRSLLENQGNASGLLEFLAQDADWPALETILERHGAEAITPGRCGWAARLPPGLLERNPWCALAEARRLLDDGALAAAATMASKACSDRGNHEVVRIATGICHSARLWGPQPPDPRAHPLDALRAATRNSPGYFAGSITGSTEPMAALSAGLALQLAGNQRASLPLLAGCATQTAQGSTVALSAQLALAVVGPGSAGTEPLLQSTDADAVARQASSLGFSWLARLAAGIAAALDTGQDAFDIRKEAVTACDAGGDGWGAALITMVAALTQMRQGIADPAGLDALAKRFRQLGAGTLEAWVRSAEALAAFSARETGAEETAVRAEMYARKADIPGAAALSYAALAFHRPDRQQELIQLANSTARSSGLVWRPWTWLQAPISQTPRPLMIEVVDRSVANEISVRCLGGFTLRVGGEPVELSQVRPRARTVLRMLALHAGRPVHREQLAGALWAELEYPAALHNLQVSLSSLRGALQRIPSTVAERLIVRRGEAYCLAPGESGCCDLQEFDEVLREAGQAQSSGDTLAAILSLRRVLDLYTGEVLPEDGSAEWVVSVRDHYRMRAAEAASNLALLELEAGRPDAAVAAATRSVDIDPWRDSSWRTLVGVCQSSRNHAAAERAQRSYERMLKELGVEYVDLAGGPAR